MSKNDAVIKYRTEAIQKYFDEGMHRDFVHNIQKGLHMSYTALYRKFRPATFDEVKGQDHIVQTLKNQIKSGRIGHAYLFCGTRGTGKTSVAKILAKAVNCESPEDGNPCNQCASCDEIGKGSSLNVVEIDAASNNGVDNIRQIREEIQYSPTDGKYKVYIIDEVHMLSIGAFNALLKTLEEPPEYVIFILATTEPRKIPITILSRCQRYDFKRITIDTISKRLSELMEVEQTDVEEKAIRYIAKAADGSMRDALSLLDQCIAFYPDQTLTYENVLEVLGAVDSGVFSELLRAIISGNVSECINVLDEIVLQGRELNQFVTDFIWYMRNLLLVKTSDNIEDVIDASAERVELLKEEADMIEADVLMRYIRVFSELSNQIKYSAQKRVLIEMALIKLNMPAMDNDLSSVINRISNLEKRLDEGTFMIKEAETGSTKEKKAEENKPQKPKFERAVPEDVQYVVDNWDKISKRLPSRTRILLKNIKFSVKGEDILLMVFEGGTVAYEMCNTEEVINLINDTISNEMHKQIRVEMESVDADDRFENHYQEVLKKIKMEVEDEEEF